MKIIESKTDSQDANKTRISIDLKSTTFNVLIAYIAICIFFGILSPYFFSLKNFLNIGAYASIMGILATGLTMALITGGLDISISSIAAFAGMIVSALLKAEYPTIVCILAALCCGLVGGLLNGTIITKFKINPIITTLGTMSIFRGLSYALVQGKSITITNEAFLQIGRGFTLGIPNSIIIMILSYIVIGYILSSTPFGRKIYAIGGNSYASYLSGINVNKTRFLLYLIAGVMSALAGIIMTAQNGAGLPQAGTGIEMDVVAAVILGGVSLAGGKGNVVGTFLGVLLLATVANGMVLLNIQSYYQLIVKGGILILAVLIDAVRGGGYE